MHTPPIPADEARRTQALYALHLLDTPPEERFDRYTRIARRLFDVPIALVSLVDHHRQWFKSRQGLAARQTPRAVSFCGHTILGEEILVVPDASRDERFADNPLVTGEPHIRFYAGRPLRAPDGSKLGTLCIIDRRPRRLSPEDLHALEDLGGMVEQELATLALATVDELTGLTNRRGFLCVANHALALCHRNRRPATLIFFDLDNLKAINDGCGHEAGDAALKAFAHILLEAFRDSDVVARLGGDEFCTLLTGTLQQQLSRPVRRLNTALQAHNARAGQPFQLAYSMGAVLYSRREHRDVADLLADADRCMYEHKRGKRETEGGALPRRA